MVTRRRGPWLFIGLYKHPSKNDIMVDILEDRWQFLIDQEKEDLVEGILDYESAFYHYTEQIPVKTDGCGEPEYEDVLCLDERDDGYYDVMAAKADERAEMEEHFRQVIESRQAPETHCPLSVEREEAEGSILGERDANGMSEAELDHYLNVEREMDRAKHEERLGACSFYGR